MARGMTTVRSRTQPKETISFPVLTYTDALPRDDLFSLEASQRPAQPMIGQWDFSQPSAGDGWLKKPPSGQGATFDFRITAPPDEAIQTDHAQTEQHMIGIALGSPGMLTKDEPLPPPRFDTFIIAERDSAHKPSKWKKIGGLFKAKNAPTSIPGGAQESVVKPHSNNYKLPEKPPKARLRKNSTEEWPKFEVEPRKMPGRSDQTPQRSRNFSLGNKPTKDESSTHGLLLSVEIPDIQMERYSVMFSDVVNKNQKPSLLARRAKTLDNLLVPDANDFLKPAPPPVPQRRRATSPARSDFTLFPTSHPSKAAQILGTQNFSRGPNPLIRAKTLPIESPSRMPAPQLRYGSNMDSVSSFESPVIPKLFSERSNTPQSSSSYDKPLPAIKPEPQTTIQSQKISQPDKNTLSSQKTRPQQSVQPHNIVVTKPVAQPWVHLQPRKDSLPRAIEKQSQVTSPQHQPNMTSSQQRTNDSVRPCLRVQTEDRPQPPAKDTLSSSPSRSSPSALNPTQDKIDRIMSPLSASTGPKSGASPADSMRMPFVDAVETPDTAEQAPAPEPRRPIPRVEVSIARTVSVSRAKQQVLVPIGMRIDHLTPEERVVQRRPLTPQITDAHRGHRAGVSQELQIECL
ncbi:hypothetical protein CBS147355_4665 [Penicillium roqueforti]|nr:hypothetical protein CBS147355_4665 [Penicillium roqueforti]KAI2714007.1 hypothetical protein CBS147354_7651 [Penicillium roqueforti]KAI3205494.1 hypothetical protein CBS147311_3553 [Penicillium roqueforti]KAI3228369.1 hypothetical protein DTO012A9_8866 [Penicillium roqueforti]KAI3237436.1 hypothetical protein CBS147310_3317 [Penicillium roqueforti]